MSANAVYHSEIIEVNSICGARRMAEKHQNDIIVSLNFHFDRKLRGGVWIIQGR